MFKTESNIATQEKEQQGSIDEEIEAETKGLFATENLKAETKEAKVLNWWSLKHNTYILSALQENIFMHAPSSFIYSKRLYSEAAGSL